MKVTIVGVEVNEGVSKKSGNEYSIGRLHVLVKLAPPNPQPGLPESAQNVAVGSASYSYDCPTPVCRGLKSVLKSGPVIAEVETETLMKFGKPETVVVDVKPVTTVTVK